MAAKERKKAQSSLAFGSRTLDNKDDVYTENAWDQVEWTQDQLDEALVKIEKQVQSRVSNPEVYHENPALYWNEFYKNNSDKFFKDRHWLSIEFPDVFENIIKTPTQTNIFEIGCGVGNTVFPLLTQTKDADVFVYAADYAPHAIEILKGSPAYDTARSLAFCYDITTPIPDCIKAGSLDIISCVFVLSALHPDQWNAAVDNIYKLLKPGGLVIFRDYGRHDLVQLRFKKNRYLDANFYVRGDGTRVYFFTNEECVSKLFTADKFIAVQNAADRRLIVNRSKKIQMHRVWLQGCFQKIDLHDEKAHMHE